MFPLGLVSVVKQSVRVGASWDDHGGMSTASGYSLVSHDVGGVVLTTAN